MANINIPLPATFEDDMRAALRRVAYEVVDEVRTREQYGREYMTQKEACKYLGIAYATLQKWRDMGLKISVIDGKTIVSKTALRAFLKQYEV